MGCGASNAASGPHAPTEAKGGGRRQKQKYEEVREKDTLTTSSAAPTSKPDRNGSSDKLMTPNKESEVGQGHRSTPIKGDDRKDKKKGDKDDKKDKDKDKDKKDKDKEKDKRDLKDKRKDKRKVPDVERGDGEKAGRFKGSEGEGGKPGGEKEYRKGKSKGRDKRMQYLSTMNQVSPFAEDLAPYVPWAVLKQFKIEPTMQPDFASFPGVVMLVDMTGYTRLGESLSRLKGLLGVELLAAYINGYFTKLIEIVDEYGGSVERFAGDALIVVFGSPFSHAPIEVLNAQAANCGLAIQKRHTTYTAKISKDAPGEADENLTVHIGIGTSLIKTITVGGVGDSWRKILFGSVFNQLGSAVPLSKPGEVVVSQQCMNYLENTKEAALYETEPRGDDNYLLRLKSGENVPSGTPLPKISLTTVMEKGVRGFIDLFVQSRIDEGQPEISETRELSMLFMGVNGWAQLQQEMNSTSSAGFTAIHQLIRSIQNTVYTYEGCIANCLVDEKGFIIIVTYGMPQHSDDPLLAVKSAMEIKETGEKLGIGLSIAVTTGNTFVGTIGSKSRRDYTIMGSAVNLGARLMTMCEMIHSQSLEAGKEGNEGTPSQPNSARAHTAKAGSATPNLNSTTNGGSAALSPHSAAVQGGAVSEASVDGGALWSQILVDDKTFQLTKKTCLYQMNLEALELRGCDGKVPIYCPQQIFKGRRDFAAYQKAAGEDQADCDYDEDEERRIVKVSRAAELKTLEAIRDEVASDNKSCVKTRVVFVYGEGGSGKSFLIRICGQPIMKNELPGMWLESSQVDHTSSDTAYNVWEPIFSQLLMTNIPAGVTKAQHVQKCFETLSQCGDWMEFGYLNLDIPCFMAMMNPVLKTQFREPQGLADLGPALRAKTTVSLLHIILKHFSRIQPLYILFDQMENCHDLQSLELMLALAESKDKRNPIMVFCSLRPTASGETADTIARAEASRLLMKTREFTQSVTSVTLKPLTQELATELFIHLLNAELENNHEIPVIKVVDPDLAFFVYKNSQNGKTFLLVAIVNSFRDELVVSLSNPDAKTSLAVTGSRLHMVGDDDAVALHLPESVTHFARSTVDRLPPTQQLIVKYASVVGKRFNLDSVTEIFPIQKSRTALLHGVLKLVEQRILVEVKGSSGDTVYRFADGVVQDEAYGMVLQEQRRTIHKQLAELTEKKLLTDIREKEDGADAEAEHIGQLARHWSSYVRLTKEQCTYEEVDRAIFCLKKHAYWLMQRTEYAGAYDMLRTAQRFIPLLHKKSNGDEDDMGEVEVQLLGDMTSAVQRARLRFSCAIVLHLHKDLLSVEIENVTDELWEVRYRALCGKAVELARVDRFDEAHDALRQLSQVTKEAGGEIEGVLQACTTISVLLTCADNVSDVVEIAKEALEVLRSMEDLSIFASSTLSTFFSGLSTGHPMHDVLCSLKLAYTIQGSFHLAEGLEEALIPEKGQSVKGLNEARVHCLACPGELLAQNSAKARRYAEHALELASRIGDHVSVALANFYLAIVKTIPEEAYASLKVLENAVGLMYLERCLLLESVAEGDSPVSQYSGLLQRPPSHSFLSAELMRLQGIVLYKLSLEDPAGVKPFVASCNSATEAGVLAEVEERLVSAVNQAKSHGQHLFYLQSLASLLRFWTQTGVLSDTPEAAQVTGELWRVKDKLRRQCGSDAHFSRIVMESDDAHDAGTTGNTPQISDKGLCARSCDVWASLVSKTG